jgi:hypothetical protein
MTSAQELAQARQQAERTRTQLAEQRRKAIESATSKRALLSNGGIAGRQSRAATIQQAGQISEQEKQLQTYESQLKVAEQQQVQQQAQQQEYETAIKVYAGLIKRPTGFDEYSPISKQAREYIKSVEPSYGSVQIVGKNYLKDLKIYTSPTGEKYLSTPELEKVGAEYFKPYLVSNTEQAKKYGLKIGSTYSPKKITDITPDISPIEAIGKEATSSKKTFESPEGTMYRRQIDTYKDKQTGKVIPITRTYIIKDGREKVATDEEVKYYNEQTNFLVVPEKQKGIQGISDYLTEQRNRLATERARENSIDYKNDFSSFLVGAGTSFISTPLFFTNVVKHPIETIKAIPSGVEQSILSLRTVGSTIRNEPMFSLGYVTAEYVQKKAGDVIIDKGFTLFGKKPIKVVATSEFEETVEPFTRQRATLILKTEDGRYILGKTNSGNIISIGGGIEAGQTTKQAILSELFQETGLNLDDIKNLKSKGKIVTAEETFKIYTATVPDEALKKIVAGSDISEIKVLSSNQIGKTTGQTARYPVNLPSGVRAYEVGIINWLETGKKPTLLKVDTNVGEFYLGTQSRYNVPYSSQKKYLQTIEPELFASGTTNPAKLNEFFPINKEFKVIGSKTVRGQAEGLYLQPPVSNIKGSAGYVGLSYAGLGDDVTESLGITFKRPKSVVYTLKEQAISPIVPTPKTFSGAESELIISPNAFLKTTGTSEKFTIGGKRVFFQPLEIVKDAKSLSEISRLQEIINLGTSSERLKALKKLSTLTGVDYTQGQLTYINLPSIATKTIFPLIKSSKEIEKEQESRIILSKEKTIEIPKEIKRREFNLKYTNEPLETLREHFFDIIKKEPYKKELLSTIKEKAKTTQKKIPYIKPVSIYLSKKEKPSARETLIGMFEVFKKEKGIFKKVGEAETPFLAGRKLSTELFKDLSASGFVAKKGKALKFEELGMSSQFRPSKQKGKGFLAVQKETGFLGGRLTSQRERKQIQQARRKKNINWFD